MSGLPPGFTEDKPPAGFVEQPTTKATPSPRPSAGPAPSTTSAPRPQRALPVPETRAPLVNRLFGDKTVSSVAEKFVRPLTAVEAALNGGGWGGVGSALSGATDPATAAGNHQRILDALAKHNYGVIPNSLEDLQQYGSKVGRPGPLTGAGDFAEQVVGNPLSWLGLQVGGRSAIARGTEQLERFGMPAAVKAGKIVNKVPVVGPAVTNVAAKAHDFLGVHSAAKRTLAETHGPNWKPEYASRRATLLNGGAQVQDLAADLQAHLDSLPEGPMRDSFVRSLDRASQGLPFAEELSTPLRGRAAQAPTGEVAQQEIGLQGATDLPIFSKAQGSHYYPHPPVEPEQPFLIPPPSEPVQGDLFGVPPPAAAEAVSPVAARATGPTPRIAPKPKISPADLKSATMVGGKPMWPDPVSGEMLPMPPRIPEGPATISGRVTADRATARYAGRTQADARAPFQYTNPPLARSPLEELLAPPTPAAASINDLIPPPTARQTTRGPNPSGLTSKVGKLLGEEAPAADPILDMMKPKGLSWQSPLNSLSDFMTASMFAPPLGNIAHEANVSMLGAVVDPLATANAIGRGLIDTGRQAGAVAAKIPGISKFIPATAKTPETLESIAARHAPAQRGGGLSDHAGTGEQGDVLTGGLQGLIDKLMARGQSVSSPRGTGAANELAGVLKLGQSWYKMGNDSLWKFENEVRAQRFNTLVKGGMPENEAGLRVGGEMVDYGNRSPLASNLRPVAPFANWRLQMPMAVARGSIENPGRVAALTSAFPALTGGTQGEDPTTGKPLKSKLPYGDILGALSEGPTGAAKYGVGFLGGAPRLAGDAAEWLLDQSRGPQWGKSWMQNEAESKKARTRWTYGVEPGTFALNSLPGVGRGLEMSGHGMFNKTGDVPDALAQLLKSIRIGP